MEALADFGAVNLLNYRALTDAIYRVWYGAFDRAAALQLATVLVSLTLALVALERLLRGRARYHQALVRGEALVPRRLPGARGAGSRRPLPGLVVLAGRRRAARRSSSSGRSARSARARSAPASRAPRPTACCWRCSRRCRDGRGGDGDRLRRRGCAVARRRRARRA